MINNFHTFKFQGRVLYLAFWKLHKLHFEIFTYIIVWHFPPWLSPFFFSCHKIITFEPHSENRLSGILSIRGSCDFFVSDLNCWSVCGLCPQCCPWYLFSFSGLSPFLSVPPYWFFFMCHLSNRHMMGVMFFIFTTSVFIIGLTWHHTPPVLPLFLFGCK